MKRRRISNNTEDGSTDENHHCADDNRKSPYYDEKISVQFGGAAGDYGSNVQSSTKKRSSSGKRKKLNHDGNLPSVVVPASSCNIVTSVLSEETALRSRNNTRCLTVPSTHSDSTEDYCGPDHDIPPHLGSAHTSGHSGNEDMPKPRGTP